MHFLDSKLLSGAGWLCKDCVVKLGASLKGSKVNVWWHDDEKSYEGIIIAFDEVSKCHQIEYENEWEFVNLAIEPVAFQSEYCSSGKDR